MNSSGRVIKSYNHSCTNASWLYDLWLRYYYMKVLVDSRIMNSVSSRRWRFGIFLPERIFSISIAQACCPMWKAGWLMVVIVGEVMREVSTLSKPMTESSSGTLIPKLWAALMAAAAKTSEQVKNASGRSLEESSCKIEEYAKV